MDFVLECGNAFNSQPHEEADRVYQNPQSTTLPFNSQPHEEADCSEYSSVSSTESFNSQPHEEADGNFEQKYLLRNCIFYNYCIYYFLYLSCIQLFMHFFSLNLPIFRCECPRESCVLSFRTYNIKVSVTSKPGLAPICSILFLYFSPK